MTTEHTLLVDDPPSPPKIRNSNLNHSLRLFRGVGGPKYYEAWSHGLSKETVVPGQGPGPVWSLFLRCPLLPKSSCASEARVLTSTTLCPPPSSEAARPTWPPQCLPTQRDPSRPALLVHRP